MRRLHVIMNENQIAALWVALVNHLPSIDDETILPLPNMLYDHAPPVGAGTSA